MLDDRPTVGDVAEAIAYRMIAQCRADLVVSTQAGAATNWARRMVAPGTAVTDACSGLTLMDTLVNAGVTINPEAHAVHGLTETDLLNAPELGVARVRRSTS
jgi:DNA polymerase III epsilon subunit-like protein